MAEPVVSRRTYLWITAALMVLLVLTIVAAKLPLGLLAPVVALGIAGAKAALVALYFMHIRYASPLARIFALAGLLWLVTLIGLTLTDYLTRTGPPFVFD